MKKLKLNFYKNKYDFVVGIGAACSCTQILRGSRLQFESFPFDWVAGADIITRVNIIKDKFQNWFEKEDLKYTGKREYPEPKDIYLNTKTSILYNHDFSLNSNLEDEYDKVNQKYIRRANRFLSRINDSSRVLIVYLQIPNNKNIINDTDIKTAYSILKESFPNTTIDLMYIYNDSNFVLENMFVENISENITKIGFDYDKKDLNDPVAIKVKELRTIFNKIKISNKYLSIKNSLRRLIYKIRAI